MPHETLDPDIVILESGSTVSGAPFVRYGRVSSGAQWVVAGACNRCGLCAIGVDAWWSQWTGAPGTPYSHTDLRVLLGRPDVPITPGFDAAMRRMAVEFHTVVAGCSLEIIPLEVRAAATAD